MPIIRCTTRLHRDTNMAVDDSVNVWHFSCPSPLGDIVSTGISLAVVGFYQRIYMYYSSVMIRAAFTSMTNELATVVPFGSGADDDVVSKVYAALQGPATSMPAAVGENYPEEVALVLSFAGDLVGVPEESGATRPASRKRGRIYLGPLTTNVAFAGSGQNVDLTPTANDILDSYESFLADLAAMGSNIQHAIYSPTLGNTVPIITASMDNAFDTVRSRGRAPTLRISRSVTNTGE